MTATKTPMCMVYDPTRFLCSVAFARSMQENTHTEWVEYKDSATINAIYWVVNNFYGMQKGAPGNVEIRQSSVKKIQADADKHLGEYFDKWLTKLHTDPKEAREYLVGLERRRANELEALETVFRDARDINEAIVGETRNAIRKLAAIKLASTIAVAGIGAYMAIVPGVAGAALASLVGYGYSQGCTLITEWHKGEKADAVGVYMNVGKAAVGEVGGEIAKEAEKTAMMELTKNSKAIADANRKIKDLSENVKNTGLTSMKRNASKRAAQATAKQTTKNMAQQTRNLKMAEQGMEQAAQGVKSARIAGRLIPLVFAAWDIWDGVTEFRDFWQKSA